MINSCWYIQKWSKTVTKVLYAKFSDSFFFFEVHLVTVLFLSPQTKACLDLSSPHSQANNQSKIMLEVFVWKAERQAEVGSACHWMFHWSFLIHCCKYLTILDKSAGCHANFDHFNILQKLRNQGQSDQMQRISKTITGQTYAWYLWKRLVTLFQGPRGFRVWALEIYTNP